MEFLPSVPPRPRGTALLRLDAERREREALARRIEARDRRWTPPIDDVETRAAARACPACGFGGYTGKCTACTYTPGQRRTHTEQRTRAADTGAERRTRQRVSDANTTIEHGPAGPIIGIR